MRPTEIIFEVTEAAEGGYDARALGHSIFTQGEDWNDLKARARDAVLCHFMLPASRGCQTPPSRVATPRHGVLPGSRQRPVP